MAGGAAGRRVRDAKAEAPKAGTVMNAAVSDGRYGGRPSRLPGRNASSRSFVEQQSGAPPSAV